MTGLGLFDGDENLKAGDGSHQIQEAQTGAIDRAARVRRSALWSAYGDALGWIAELTDEKGLGRRTAGEPLCKPIKWKRKIGGFVGVTATLPQGCYSDDSQLRLATGRSIRSDGFDVEAFSKVELPVWLSYALGGGRSTSAAAANLAKPRVQWFANTFKGWTESGGNGAAMRIQPHVWAARDPGDPATFLQDVIRNAICTHSHPNGLMGAVFHALTLANAMVTGRSPSPDDLMAVTDSASDIFYFLQNDVEVEQYWRTAFERDAGAFGDAWAQTVADCREAIRLVSDTSNQAGTDRYATIIDLLMLRNPERRGNGMLTAVAAAGLTWCDPQPESAMSIAANALGTDTDTIATMAGAILGLNAETDPPVEVLDADLFRSEADRLSEIAIGNKPQNHRYPDLLRWSAPKTHADALVHSEGGGFYVRGLGCAEPVGEPIPSQNSGFMWQWVNLESGQTLLIKRRRDVASASDEEIGRPGAQPPDQNPPAAANPVRVSSNTPNTGYSNSRNPTPAHALWKDQLEQPISHEKLIEMIDYLEKRKHDDKAVGQVIRRVVNKCTPGQVGAFLAVLIDCLREPPNPPSEQRL